MSSKIFISYRRDDAAPWAGRIHERLSRHFGRHELFMDVDNIPPGFDFVKILDQQVGQCDVLLAIIGKDWLTANERGERRLDDPKDFVRIELESALNRDVRVIPVLVDGASMPREQDLPPSLHSLVRRQAWPLSHARFGSELDSLLKVLPTDRSGMIQEAKGQQKPSTTLATLSDTTLYVLTALALVLGIFLVSVELENSSEWLRTSVTDPAYLLSGVTCLSLSVPVLLRFGSSLRGPHLVGLWIVFAFGIGWLVSVYWNPQVGVFAAPIITLLLVTGLNAVRRR
jgi:hypothetical protein